MKLTSRVLACVAFTFLCLAGDLARCAEIILEENITYGKAGGTELKLDLARPQGNGSFPAIVFIHGGGWSGGNRQASLPSPPYAPSAPWLGCCRAALENRHSRSASKRLGFFPPCPQRKDEFGELSLLGAGRKESG